MMFGRLLALPFRLANVPMRAVEKLLDVEDDEAVASKPLESIAEAIEEAVDED